MLALLNAGSCLYTITDSYSGNSFIGSMVFKPFDTGSDGIYALSNEYKGGPNTDVTLTFEFPIDIECLSFTVSSSFGARLIHTSGNVSSLVPTNGWLGVVSSPPPSDMSQSHMEGVVNTNTILNFNSLITNGTFTFSKKTKVTGFQNFFETFWSGNHIHDFLYCINSITYTAPKPDIEDLVSTIDNLIKNNNDNTDRIIANQDDNTDKIISNQTLGANRIIQNDKNIHNEDMQQREDHHQEDMQQREDQHQEDVEQRDKLWNDTFNPSEEEVVDYAGAIFDQDVQDELMSKLGLFTFLNDTMQDLLSVFDDPGSAGTALIMPALVVPVDGVDYTIIEETPFDMADTLDQIPVLVSAIRFVSGIIIIFCFLAYLRRLRIRFFGAD